MNRDIDAKRIEQALHYSAKGTVPHDATQQLLDDIDRINQRYVELRRKNDFELASSMARTQFISEILRESY